MRASLILGFFPLYCKLRQNAVATSGSRPVENIFLWSCGSVRFIKSRERNKMREIVTKLEMFAQLQKIHRHTQGSLRELIVYCIVLIDAPSDDAASPNAEREARERKRDRKKTQNITNKQQCHSVKAMPPPRWFDCSTTIGFWFPFSSTSRTTCTLTLSFIRWTECFHVWAAAAAAAAGRFSRWLIQRLLCPWLCAVRAPALWPWWWNFLIKLPRMGRRGMPTVGGWYH